MRNLLNFYFNVHRAVRNIFLIFVAVALIGPGCAQPPLTTGSLGYESSRRVVVVGENVNKEIAAYYHKKYEALVWFTPYEGRFAHNAVNFFESGLGPSMAMRSLINELKSINYTVGRWEIIVPKIAERYFLSTLKYMKTEELSKARGIVVLIDSSGNPDMEAEVARVTAGNFFVTYEFQKELLKSAFKSL